MAGLEYENSVIEKSDKIDNDVLESEKKLYLKRRAFAGIDID
jgi:hypothetical protein